VAQVRVFGDIVVAFHWVNGEPAMCLYPKRARALGARGAAIICLSAIHKYAKSNGDPIPEYLIPKAIEAARVMGMDETRPTVKRIADAILESVEDLVKMPPEPDSLHGPQGRQIGEMSLIGQRQSRSRGSGERGDGRGVAAKAQLWRLSARRTSNASSTRAPSSRRALSGCARSRGQPNGNRRCGRAGAP
jgi:hypothetical protein